MNRDFRYFNNFFNSGRYIKAIMLLFYIYSLGINSSHGQDPLISNFEYTNYDYPWNFAWNKKIELTNTFRSQWTGLKDQGFKTNITQLTIRANEKICLGGSYLKDVEGIGKLETNAMRFHIIYNILKSGTMKSKYFNYLNTGIYIERINKRINTSTLVFSDQIDPYYGITSMTSQSIAITDIQENTVYNLGFGAFLYEKVNFLNIKGAFSLSPSFSYYLKGINSEANLYRGNEYFMPSKLTVKSSFSTATTYLNGNNGLSQDMQQLFLFGYRFTKQGGGTYANSINHSVQILTGHNSKANKSIIYYGLTNNFVITKESNLNAIGLLFGWEFYSSKAELLTSLYTGIQLPYNLKSTSLGTIWELGLSFSFGKNLRSNVFSAYGKNLCSAYPRITPEF